MTYFVTAWLAWVCKLCLKAHGEGCWEVITDGEYAMNSLNS
jgi:hypothetical protein